MIQFIFSTAQFICLTVIIAIIVVWLIERCAKILHYMTAEKNQ